VKNLLSPETLCLCKLMTDDEKILWKGKPQWPNIKKLKIIASSLIVIGMALCILINFIVIILFQLMGLYLTRLIDIIFVSIPLFIMYFIIISIILSYYVRVDRLEYTDYFITPTKIIEMEFKEKTNKIYCINLNEINDVAIDSNSGYQGNKINKTITVTFYSSNMKRFDNEENKWKSTKLRRSFISFRYIPKEEKILTVLKKTISKKLPPVE